MLHFFTQLQAHLGGEIHRAPISVRLADAADAEPPVYLLTMVDGHDLRIDSGIDAVSIQVAVPKSLRLHLTHETMGTRVLGLVHLSREVQIGDEKFDDDYLIQNISEVEARRLFSTDARKLINDLAPLVELDLADGSCRLRKSILGENIAHPLDDYTPEQCIDDIRALVKLVELWGATRVQPPNPC